MEPRQQVEREPPRGSQDPSPWRVEGPRTAEVERARPPWRGRTFWLVLIVLLVINYALGAALGPSTGRTSIPYLVFRTQVQAGNVADVESKNDEIQGTFRKATRYPPSQQGKRSSNFRRSGPR